MRCALTSCASVSPFSMGSVGGSFAMSSPLPPEHVHTSRLPVSGEHFRGRQKDLAQLTEAWRNSQVTAVEIIAFAGAGKTALLRAWLETMRADGYRSADRVYAWSFYRHGSVDRASTDEFFSHALSWFGLDSADFLHPDSFWSLASDIASGRVELSPDDVRSRVERAKRSTSWERFPERAQDLGCALWHVCEALAESQNADCNHGAINVRFW